MATTYIESLKFIQISNCGKMRLVCIWSCPPTHTTLINVGLNKIPTAWWQQATILSAVVPTVRKC